MHYKVLLYLLFINTPFLLEAQKLNTSLINEVDSLVFLDQFYRNKISELKINPEGKVSENSLSRNKQLKLFNKLDEGKYSNYKIKRDSLLRLQTKVDSSNLDRLKEIILAHGFPSKKLVGHHKAELLLYHAYESWYTDMFPILKKEVKKGNLRPITLANSYDKKQYIKGEEFLYHSLLLVGDTYKFTRSTPKDLEKTNKARVEIGLKPIKIKKNGKRKN